MLIFFLFTVFFSAINSDQEFTSPHNRHNTHHSLHNVASIGQGYLHTPVLNQANSNKQFTAFKQALNYLNSIQNPLDCRVSSESGQSAKYAVVTVGVKGGFAAQFQLVGAEFARALASSNFTIPVLIRGHIIGYSEGPECKSVGYDWSCFLLPTSVCQTPWLSSGAQAVAIKNWPSDEESVPIQYRHLGFVFWWGVVQYYLFRFQPFVYEHIQHQAEDMHKHRGFPFNLPVAGMHVRHGDKHVDGFIEHSLEEELQMVRSSNDCILRNAANDCFVPINATDSHSMAVVFSRSIQGKTVLISRENVDKFNHSTENKLIEVSAKPLLHALKQQQGQNSGEMVLQSNLNATELLLPLSIFVASDDPEVIRTAERKGYLVDSSGISQQTASTGMLTTLLSHPELGFNATLEIIADIYFLSHCSTLLGMAASQVFRIAVALSNVTGTLHYVKITDSNQVNRVKQLSRKYGVPFPENFV